MQIKFFKCIKSCQFHFEFSKVQLNTNSMSSSLRMMIQSSTLNDILVVTAKHNICSRLHVLHARPMQTVDMHFHRDFLSPWWNISTRMDRSGGPKIDHILVCPESSNLIERPVLDMHLRFCCSCMIFITRFKLKISCQGCR